MSVRALFWLTVIAAMALSLLPWPAWLEPYWAAMVLIYWGLEVRGLGRLGAAFAIGLGLDILLASQLGQHALSLVIIVYIIERFRSRIRFFPAWQQAMIVGLILLNDKIVLLWVLWLRGELWPGWAYWVPPLIAALLWPWLFLGLDRLRSMGRSSRRSRRSSNRH